MSVTNQTIRRNPGGALKRLPPGSRRGAIKQCYRAPRVVSTALLSCHRAYLCSQRPVQDCLLLNAAAGTNYHALCLPSGCRLPRQRRPLLAKVRIELGRLCFTQLPHT